MYRAGEAGRNAQYRDHGMMSGAAYRSLGACWREHAGVAGNRVHKNKAFGEWNVWLYCNWAVMDSAQRGGICFLPVFRGCAQSRGCSWRQT